MAANTTGQLSTLEAMRSAVRWLLHRDKVPFYASGRPRSGALDRPEDMMQLVSHSDATAALKRFGRGYGLGFALGPDDRGGYWQGIDLDSVEANGLIEIANTLPGYTEVSLSGSGAHAIGYGRRFDNMGSDGSGVEAYSTGRYFTFSGNAQKDGELCDLAPFVATVLSPRRKLPSIERQPAPSHSADIDESTVEHLRSALTVLDANSYDAWINAGLALKTIGEPGRILWLQWSATSPKFDSHEAEDKWRSFGPTNTSYKSIFAEAQRNGWRNPGYAQDVPLVSLEAITQQIAEVVEASKKVESRYQPKTAAQLKEQRPPGYRVKGAIPAEGLMYFYGASGSGKSFVVLDLATAIAEARPWFGHRTRAACVLYVALEGEAGYQNRVIAWETFNQRPFPSDVRFISGQSFELAEGLDVEQLARVVPPGSVVVIDTLNRAAPEADENSSKDMGRVIKRAKLLQQMTGGLIALVSHTGKDASKGLRGHSSQYAAADAAILVTRDGDERSWKVEKAKDGADGIEHQFRLSAVSIGVDDDGDEITSCVVIPDDSAEPKQAEKRLNKSQQSALHSFNEAIRELGVTAVHVNDWRKVFYRLSTADGDGAKKKAFQRARKELVELGRLVVSDDVYQTGGQFPEITEQCMKAVLSLNAGRGT